MGKSYVLDTNVLMEDPDALFSFKEHTVIVPIEVLRELDQHKNRQDLVGMNTRKAIRNLDDLRQDGWLHLGVSLANGGKLRVAEAQENCVSSDEAILKVAQNTEDCELITNDIALRVIAGSVGVHASSYEWNGQKNTEDVFSGAARIHTDSDVISQLFREGSVELPPESLESLDPNQFLIMKNGNQGSSAIARYKDGAAHTIRVTSNTDVGGLKPRNKEQMFALDILLNPDIPLVTLLGKAGCGKSLMAVAAGLQQVLDTGRYDKILVSRPIQPLGKDIGFLPGSLEEKMAPWIQPIKDSLHFLLGKDSRTIEMLFEEGTIEIEALSYIRGRSIPNSYVIIDEAQNLSVPEMKAIVTRIGEGSKIVITGDIEQVDSHRFDSHTNGLAYLVEKMRSQELAGHITLLKGERSKLATLAADIL